MYLFSLYISSMYSMRVINAISGYKIINRGFWNTQLTNRCAEKKTSINIL